MSITYNGQPITSDTYIGTCVTDPGYYRYNTITTTNHNEDIMTENEVNIEKVDNGFIIGTKDKTFVASGMVNLCDILREYFETLKQENK